ncbi:MAG: hypothetical protein LBC72_03785, partial [Spirochaetaceae bacterium]|nr:hypothetical protein [Spirochaetaceae bacterium]
MVHIEAPCKINVHLDIGEKRADGLHELSSVFVALPLCDSLTVRLVPSGGGQPCALDVQNGGLPPELWAAAAVSRENIVLHAAALFRECAPLPALAVRLVKRIPAGAGLGGASADAAAALLAFNRLLPPSAALDSAALLALAARLGSDVPFFLWALESSAAAEAAAVPCARVGGTGERITPAPPPFPLPFWTLLAHPGFFSGTARAYALLDTWRARLSQRARRASSVDTAGGFFNSFLPAFLEDGSEEERRGYRAVLADIARFQPLYHSISGSGSVCFGIFDVEESAARAERELQERWPWCR